MPDAARRLSSMLAFLAAAVLFPVAAYGSFGGTPCRDDFGCHFLFWGVILGAVGGVPVSVVAFILLHLFFCHPARPKGRQVLVGGVAGVVAFGIGGVFAALMASWDKNPWIGLIASIAVLAIASALYARSSPRDQPDGDGGAAGR